jgi:hypothetical protein
MIKDGGPEKREPGDDFIYSNSGYVVLAKIIEQLSGQTYKQFMNERIFKPLKMTNTTVFDERSGKIQNHAFPYGRDRQDYFAFDGYTPLNFIYGDGNIHSTLTDMIKWVGALDDVQHARRRALIKRNTLMEAFASQRLRSDLRRRLDYGFGFHVAQKGIIRVIYHGGDWPGFHSFMLYGRIEQPRQPACEITIIVLSNFEPDQNDPNQNRPCNLSKELSKVFWGQTKSSNIILDDVFCGSKPNSDCGKLPSCNGANLQPGD